MKHILCDCKHIKKYFVVPSLYFVLIHTKNDREPWAGELWDTVHFSSPSHDILFPAVSFAWADKVDSDDLSEIYRQPEEKGSLILLRLGLHLHKLSGIYHMQLIQDKWASLGSPHIHSLIPVQGFRFRKSQTDVFVILEILFSKTPMTLREMIPEWEF